MAFGLNSRYRFRTWDGTQEILRLDADELLRAVSDDLLNYGDIEHALKQLMRRGLPMPDGQDMQGLAEMIQRLKAERRDRLERFNLDGIMTDIAEQLEAVKRLERAGLDAMERPGEAPGTESGGADASKPDADTGTDAGASNDSTPRAGSSAARQDDAATPSFARSLMGNIADGNREFLDNLPASPVAQVQALSDYEFVSPEAQKKFEELLDSLRNAFTKSFFRNIEDMVKNMSDGDIQRMKDMVKALNEMLVKRIAGEDPGFDGFMKEFGDMFGADPPQSLDELIEQMQQQMAAMQSLMMSLPTEQFEQLQSLMQDRFGDPELDRMLRDLSKELEFLSPGGRRHRFRGDEDLDLAGAMDMMTQMSDLDRLEESLQDARRSGRFDHIDVDKLREMLDDDAAESVAQMKNLMQVLEDAGYVKQGERGWELTARASRKIGQQALGAIYEQLKRHSLGRHATPEEGRTGERLDVARPYEIGDPFHLHMTRTLGNALRREGPGTPVKLHPDDFEIHRSESVTQTATALLVDLSWSMILRDAFPAAKRVALALHNLISASFPRDSLYLIGFSAYANVIDPRDLPMLQADEYTLGTNMQHALMLAESKLARHTQGTRQIIMISDGEPTAHLENGDAQFAYPPSPITIMETLKAVKRCTRKHITINTFMLEQSYFLRAFMTQMMKINGGRVFFTTPDHLGEYILVDYMAGKKKQLQGR